MFAWANYLINGIHLNKQESLWTSHLEAYHFNAGEGQSATFCRNSQQIYRTLFVSNSRNQQVATNLFQVTAYAFNTMNNIRWNVYMNFTKITRYLTKLRNSDLSEISDWSTCCNDLKAKVRNCKIWHFSKLTIMLEIKTAVSIGIWNSINNDRLPWSVIFKHRHGGNL